MPGPLKIGSLFSGIGGLELGLEMAGVGETIWQVEQDPFCHKILSRHWPNADRSITDVKNATPAVLPPVDVLCGGFPCQDVSAAGKGAGLQGARSGLWFEFARLVDSFAPLFCVVENVASASRRWVDQCRIDLGRAGYATLPIPLAANDVGAPHKRARVFILATHTQRLQVWHQQQWGSSGRAWTVPPEGQAIALDDGLKGDLAGREQNPWATLPEVRSLANGLPDDVDDQLRALGNAVVPQCAEVVGWSIRLIGGW